MRLPLFVAHPVDGRRIRDGIADVAHRAHGKVYGQWGRGFSGRVWLPAKARVKIVATGRRYFDEVIRKSLKKETSSRKAGTGVSSAQAQGV